LQRLPQDEDVAWSATGGRGAPEEASGETGVSLPQSARRPLGQASTRLEFLGTWTFGRERLVLSGPLALSARTWPGRVEPEEEPDECDKRPLGAKPLRHHGQAPSDGRVLRAVYRVFALGELSAGLGYTTLELIEPLQGGRCGPILHDWLPSTITTPKIPCGTPLEPYRTLV
jgi:hypothetical protein